MRSFEAPRARSPLGSELKLAAASAAVLLAPFFAGCERIHRPTEEPDVLRTMPDKVQREGMAKPAAEVLALVLQPSQQPPAEPSVAFSTLQIKGAWQAEDSNAGRFNDLAVSSYAITISSGAPGQVDRAIVPWMPAGPGELVHQRLLLRYNYRRMQVLDRNRQEGDANRETFIISQEVVARTTGERQADVAITQDTPSLSHTSNNYATALGQILYTFAQPPGNDVDVLMHQHEAAHRTERFRGEVCGSITSAGMSNSIYCMREVQRECAVVIDGITQQTDEHGLVTVKVFYHKEPTLPATPGR